MLNNAYMFQKHKGIKGIPHPNSESVRHIQQNYTGTQVKITVLHCVLHKT